MWRLSPSPLQSLPHMSFLIPCPCCQSAMSTAIREAKTEIVYVSVCTCLRGLFRDLFKSYRAHTHILINGNSHVFHIRTTLTNLFTNYGDSSFLTVVLFKTHITFFLFWSKTFFFFLRRRILVSSSYIQKNVHTPKISKNSKKINIVIFWNWISYS